jgi:hypothetical protein
MTGHAPDSVLLERSWNAERRGGGGFEEPTRGFEPGLLHYESGAVRHGARQPGRVTGDGVGAERRRRRHRPHTRRARDVHARARSDRRRAGQRRRRRWTAGRGGRWGVTGLAWFDPRCAHSDPRSCAESAWLGGSPVSCVPCRHVSCTPPCTPARTRPARALRSTRDSDPSHHPCTCGPTYQPEPPAGGISRSPRWLASSRPPPLCSPCSRHVCATGW